MQKITAGLLFALLAANCFAKSRLPAVHDGDIIFQTSRSAQSLAIQRATDSPYSHVGLIFHRAGKPYVFEAIATVQYTPLERWIARGEGRHFVVKRLRQANTRLSPSAAAKLKAAALKFSGHHYDLAFGWSDTQMYCSELVWKAYDRALGLQLGKLQKMREFKLDDPAVKAKLRERYGDQIPIDEPVISPATVFESDQLVTVAER